MDERTLSEYLFAAQVAHDLVEVDGAASAAEAARALGVPLEQVVKTLVCRTGEGHLLTLVPGDRELSLTKLRELRGAHEAALATRREVERVTGYAVGAVAPLALSSPLPILADLPLREQMHVYCGGGSTKHMLRIAVTDLERLTGLIWADVSLPVGSRDKKPHPSPEAYRNKPAGRGGPS